MKISPTLESGEFPSDPELAGIQQRNHELDIKQGNGICVAKNLNACP